MNGTRRWTALLLGCLLALGCRPPSPETFKADPAVYRELVLAAAPKIDPDPDPDPDPDLGDCTNCGGDGELGDGTVTFKCTVCSGDGWLDKDAPIMHAPEDMETVELRVLEYGDGARAVDDDGNEYVLKGGEWVPD